MYRLGTRQHKVVIVEHEEQIANTLIDYYLEGVVPINTVNIIEDINQEPIFQMKWFNC